MDMPPNNPNNNNNPRDVRSKDDIQGRDNENGEMDVFGDLGDQGFVMVLFLMSIANWMLRERCVCWAAKGGEGLKPNIYQGWLLMKVCLSSWYKYWDAWNRSSSLCHFFIQFHDSLFYYRGVNSGRLHTWVFRLSSGLDVFFKDVITKERLLYSVKF